MSWDYTKKDYKKQATDEKWHLERLINYGQKGEKLKRELLEKYLPELNIPEDRRAFLELLLWGKRF